MVSATQYSMTVAGMIGLMVAMGIGRFAFTPVLPMMVGDGLISTATGGWLASANYSGYFIGALAGSLTSWQVMPFLVTGLIVITVSTVGMGITSAESIWFLLRFLAGAASALVFISISTSCMNSAKADDKVLSNGWLFSGVGAGTALAGLTCYILMINSVSARSAWIVLGGLAFAGSIIVVRILKSGVARSKQAGVIGWPSNRRNAMLLVMCYGTFGFGYIIPATFLPVMAKELLGESSLYGWTWPIFGLAACISTIAASRLMKAFNNRKIWSLSSLAMAIGVMLPLVDHSFEMLLLSGVLVGGTFMVITMAGMQEAALSAGAEAGRLVAMMTASFALGQILGPITISAMLSKGHGYESGLAIASILLAISAAAIWKR